MCILCCLSIPLKCKHHEALCLFGSLMYPSHKDRSHDTDKPVFTPLKDSFCYLQPNVFLADL